MKAVWRNDRKKKPTEILNYFGGHSLGLVYVKQRLNFLVAEPPVIAFEFSSFCFLLSFFNSLNTVSRRDNNSVFKESVLRPVSRHSNAVLISELHPLNCSQDLFHITTQFLRIIEYYSNKTFVVYDEYCSDCVGSFPGMDQSQFFCNCPCIGDNWELNLNIEIIFDPFFPFDMSKYLINTQTD